MRSKDKLLHIQKLNENINNEAHPELVFEDALNKLRSIYTHFENDEHFVKGYEMLITSYNEIFDYGHGETHGY